MDKNNQLLLLTTDVVFKMFFADERSKDILLYFLQAVLGLPDDEVSELEILNPTINKVNIGDRDYIVDVRLKTKSGHTQIFEMQAKTHPAFNERIACSNARTFSTQLKPGDEFTKLKKVTSIVITKFSIFEDVYDYHNIFEYRTKNGLLFTDFQQIHTLELPKIPKTATTEKDRWMKFLKIEREEEADMLAQESPIIGKAVLRLKTLSADEEARQLAYEREEGQRIRSTIEKVAREEGRTKGIVEGKLEVARKLLEINRPISEIIMATELTQEEISTLKKH